MLAYQALLKKVLSEGESREDRTGTGTISLFDANMKFNLQESFPAITTKKLAFKAMMGELLWFINGETRLSDLRYRTFGERESNKKTIWDDNQKSYADRTGIDDDCGKIYGYLWNSSNQLADVINRIKSNPTDRRLLVSAWIPDIVNDNSRVALPPCHYAYQFYVRQGKFLDLKWHQRSVDAFLGLPFNIASYAALVHLVASITGLEPGTLIFDGGDVHIYNNHVDQVNELLTRQPYTNRVQFKSIKKISSLDDLKDLTSDDFYLEGYECHPPIKAKMAI